MGRGSGGVSRTPVQRPSSRRLVRKPRDGCNPVQGRSELEGWAGIEPANTGFADPRVSHFATSPVLFTQRFLTLRLPPKNSGPK